MHVTSRDGTAIAFKHSDVCLSSQYEIASASFINVLLVSMDYGCFYNLVVVLVVLCAIIIFAVCYFST